MALEPTAYVGKMSVLEAVNRMLKSIGEKSVSSLENSNPDVVEALRTLLEASREVQARGWHFNTYRSYVINPTPVTGVIALPGNTLKVDSIDGWAGRDVVERDNKLYDNLKNSFNIGKPVTLDYVALLPFESIPHSARWYITVKATRRFATDEQNSDNAFRFSREDEIKAEAALKSDDAAISDRNALQVNPHIRRMRRR